MMYIQTGKLFTMILLRTLEEKLINEQSLLFGSNALIASSKNSHSEVVKLLLADKRG